MIIDKLSNADLYFNINDRIKSALEYLMTANLANIKTGRHDIDGDNIFALISDYTTKDRTEKKLESHKKYIDLQYVSKGNELMGYTPLNGQLIAQEYDEEKDIMFYDGVPDFIIFNEGMFVILFPEDLHMPGIINGSASEVRKIVIKVRI